MRTSNSDSETEKQWLKRLVISVESRLLSRIVAHCGMFPEGSDFLLASLGPGEDVLSLQQR
jgi:hypothetical protein